MKLGLRARLLIPTLVAILIGMCLLSFVTYRGFTNSMRDMISSEMERDLKTTADHIDQWLEERGHDVKSWSNSDALPMAVSGSDFLMRKAREASRDQFAQFQAEYAFYANIFLLNRNGVLCASSRYTSGGLELSHEPWVVATLHGESVISAPFVLPGIGIKVFSVSTPVYSNEKNIIGVLSALVDLEAFSTKFLNEMGRNSGYASIIDKEGMVIAHPRRDRILRENVGDTEYGRRIRDRRSDTFVHQSGATQWITSFATISRTGWVLVRTRSLDEAFAPAIATGVNSLLTAFVLMIVVTLIVIATVTGVTRAIHILAVEARDVASGNLEVRIECNRNDEIGELASSFREVVQSFHETALICEQVAEGDFSHNARVRGPHDRLGRAVNQMATMLREAVGQANAVSRGDFATPIEPHSERDSLRMALRNMTQRLRTVTSANERQVWIKTGLTDLNDQVRDQSRIGPLTKETITFLAKYTQSTVGAFYLARDGELQRSAAYAGGEVSRIPEAIGLGEGLVGQAALDRKSKLVEHLPPNYVKAVSGLGDASPRELVIVPLTYRDELKGVIELATLGSFSEAALEFLDQAAEDVAIAVHAVHSREQLQELLERSQAQAEELQVQQEELRQANEELEARARAMAESEQKLQAQQEELRQANDELTKRARARNA